MPRRLLSAVFSLLLFCTVVGNAESEESEAPESAVSSPPMEMDDPGTPGPRGIEINFVGSQERMGLDRRLEMLLDANIGIGDRIQLKYERPFVSMQEEDIPHQKGLGPTEFGIKWRMVDHGGWRGDLSELPAG